MHPQLQLCKFDPSKMRVIAVLILGVMAGCATDSAYQSVPIENRTVQKVPSLEQNQAHTEDQSTPLDQRDINIERAEYYQRLSASSDDRGQIDSKLSAAEYYIQGNDFYAASESIVSLAEKPLQAVQRDRYDVVQAYIAYSEDRFRDTLNQLQNLLAVPPTPPSTTDDEVRFKPYQQRQVSLSRQQVDALLLSSFCYQQLGDYDLAIDALLKRESGLVGAARAETTRYTWQVINSIPSESRQLIMKSTDNALVRNRLEQSLQGEVAVNEEAPAQFTQWREEQGSSNKQTINDDWSAYTTSQVAVLLPLSSKFNKAAQALLDGIRYQDEQNTSLNKPTIQVYDVGDNPFQAPQYHAMAVQAGADVVIGPLGMDFANQVSSRISATVPTVLLGGDQALYGNSIRLTMSPELEGRSVAEKALQDGHLTAAVLAPTASNDQRVVNAFTERWLELGGKISRVVNYSEKQYDHSVELKQLFAINQSEYRHRQLSNALGQTPKFAAYRRRDIDLVFMVANNDTGRIVRPQINFFSGSKIPVYSTSSVFNGIQDTIRNTDLNNTFFPVMPWVLKSIEVAQYAGTLNELFALGSDAYRIAGNFERLRADSNLAINGNTGQLSIDNYGEVKHVPVWAQFREGQATPIQSLGMDLSPIQNHGQGGHDQLNKQGVYNDSNWDPRNARRKTGS